MSKTAHRNVTLSLPEPLVRKFRVYAAEHNRSMTALMTEAINTMIDPESSAAQAKRQFLDRLKNPPNLGTKGKISWTRQELHER